MPSPLKYRSNGRLWLQRSVVPTFIFLAIKFKNCRERKQVSEQQHRDCIESLLATSVRQVCCRNGGCYANKPPKAVMPAGPCSSLEQGLAQTLSPAG